MVLTGKYIGETVQYLKNSDMPEPIITMEAIT